MLLYNFPLKWRNKGIEEPSIYCKEKAETVIFILKSNNIKSERITPSIEGGLLIYCFNEKNNRSLDIEIYNDLEVATVISDIKECKIISSEDIEDLNFKSVLKEFFK